LTLGAVPVADVPEIGFDDVVAPFWIADDDFHGVSGRTVLHDHELGLLLLALGVLFIALFILPSRSLSAVCHDNKLIN
jgi:hypothetical protein